MSFGVVAGLLGAVALCDFVGETAAGETWPARPQPTIVYITPVPMETEKIVNSYVGALLALDKSKGSGERAANNPLRKALDDARTELERVSPEDVYTVVHERMSERSLGMTDRTISELRHLLSEGRYAQPDARRLELGANAFYRASPGEAATAVSSWLVAQQEPQRGAHAVEQEAVRRRAEVRLDDLDPVETKDLLIRELEKPEWSSTVKGQIASRINRGHERMPPACIPSLRRLLARHDAPLGTENLIEDWSAQFVGQDRTLDSLVRDRWMRALTEANSSRGYRLRAMSGLACFRDAETFGVLVGQYKTSEDWMRRGDVVLAMGRRRETRAVDFVRGALKDATRIKNRSLVLWSLDSLSRLADLPGAIEPLLDAAQNLDRVIRLNALLLMGSSKSSDQRVHALFLRLLRSADSTEQDAAVLAVGRLRVKKALPVLREMSVAAREGAERMQISRAIAQIEAIE